MSKRKVSHKPIAPKTNANGHLPKDKGFWSYRSFSKSLIGLFLILTTLVIFWPMGNSQFIYFDDNAYVYDNPQVKAGLTPKGVGWAFTTMHMSNWHPLTWLSHMLDCELYGSSPGGHHWTSVLWHIASTLLLFLVLERMTGALWRSGFVATLFALHPLHVESVAWVAERKDVLSTFFWMLTLWAYVRYTERPGHNRYLMVLCFFALGLLSKAMLVTLPCVMLLLDYWPLRRMQIGTPDRRDPSSFQKSQNANDQKWSLYRLVMEKIPFFALAAGSSLVTFLAQKSWGAVASFEWLPLEARLGNALVSYVSYISKMIWPHPLALLYPHPGMLPMWQVVGAGLLLLGISFGVIRVARQYPYLIVGWLWYLGTLVPVIGLVQVGLQAMADRYTYVPLTGLFIMLAWGIPDILAGWRNQKTALGILASLWFVLLMGVTHLQILKWHDSITLFTHTLNVTTHNYLIHNMLGNALARQGKMQEAIAHYNQALQIKPDYAKAHNNLGVTLAGQAKMQEAIAHYNEALRINPNNVEVHINLAVALAAQGKVPEAIGHYTEALRIKPDFAEAHNNLGFALAGQGKMQEAMAHYNEAIRIKPDDAKAHLNLGNALAGQGKMQEAMAHYTEAIRIKPDLAQAHFSLGVAYFMIGNRGKALEEYKILKMINPDLANALSQKIFR
jgi:protein O-mannosyl-transferase